jgi:Leucine-rich repeat (LRR) protein
VRSVIELSEHETGPLELAGDDVQLVFSNEHGVPRPPAELLAVLRASKNREGVKSLVVRGSSQLSDLAVLSAFPNVAFLRVLGLKILTLDGVETLTGSSLAVVVDTDKNTKRTIAALSQTRTQNLELGHTQASDLRTAMLLGTLKQLTAGECEALPTEAPWEAPLESLALKNGRFTKLVNLAQLRRLTQLTLVGCRNLVTFEGDNSNVEWLAMSSCKQVDMSSLASLSGLKSLAVSGGRLSLADLARLPALEQVTLDRCAVDLSGELPGRLERLRKLRLEGGKAEDAANLSRRIPQATVALQGAEYRDGVKLAGA